MRWYVSACAAALLFGTGCQRRAPGPDECVKFAEMTFGHSFESLIDYADEKSAFDKLVNTCLTAPFNRQVFVCADESRAPMACLRRVHPELFSNRDVDFAIKRPRRREVL
jgi:hypothetical protein